MWPVWTLGLWNVTLILGRLRADTFLQRLVGNLPGLTWPNCHLRNNSNAPTVPCPSPSFYRFTHRTITLTPLSTAPCLSSSVWLPRAGIRERSPRCLCSGPSWVGAILSTLGSPQKRGMGGEKTSKQKLMESCVQCVDAGLTKPVLNARRQTTAVRSTRELTGRQDTSQHARGEDALSCRQSPLFCCQRGWLRVNQSLRKGWKMMQGKTLISSGSEFTTTKSMCRPGFLSLQMIRSIEQK